MQQFIARAGRGNGCFLCFLKKTNSAMMQPLPQKSGKRKTIIQSIMDCHKYRLTGNLA